MFLENQIDKVTIYAARLKEENNRVKSENRLLLE